MDDYQYVPNARPCFAIQDVSLESLMVVLENNFQSIPYPNAESFDLKGVVACDYNRILCSQELIRRKKLLATTERSFFSKIVATNLKTVVSYNGLTLADDSVIEDYRGFFIPEEGQKLVQEKAFATDACVATALLATNSLKAKKFEITDPTGKIYTVNKLLLAGPSNNVAVKSVLLTGIDLNKNTNVGDMVLRMANNIRSSGPLRFYLRDVVAQILSEGTSDKLMKAVRIVYPSADPYRKAIAALGKKPALVRYNPSGVPSCPDHHIKDENTLWTLVSRHVKVRGSDKGGLSALTQGYMLGEMGSIATPLLISFDIKYIMSYLDRDVLRKSDHSFFSKIWPLMSSNVLVNLDTAPHIALGQTVGIVYVPPKGHTFLKIAFGLPKPSVSGLSCDTVSFKDDLYEMVVAKLYRGFAVMSYARACLWRIPFATVDKSGVQTISKTTFFTVLPSALAHANVVWVLPVENTLSDDDDDCYDFNTHFNRTHHANQWKTWYPFHRTTFAKVDPWFRTDVHISISGKARSEITAFTEEEEAAIADPVVDDFDDTTIPVALHSRGAQRGHVAVNVAPEEDEFYGQPPRETKVVPSKRVIPADPEDWNDEERAYMDALYQDI